MKIQLLLRLLSDEERIAFRRAMMARRFGNHLSLVEWYDACIELTDQSPNWGDRELLKKMKHRSEKASYARQRKTAIVHCIEDFLAWHGFEGNSMMKLQSLLRVLRNRDPQNLYARHYKIELEKQKLTSWHGFEHYASILMMEDEHLQLPDSSEIHDYTQPLFQTALDAIDRSYVLKKLSLVCKAESQDRNRKTKHHVSMVDEILQWASNLEAEGEPLIQLYMRLLELITDKHGNARTSFFEAKLFLQTHTNKLVQENRPEVQDAFTYLINYCVVSIRKGDLELKPEVVELYRLLLKEHILESNGKLNIGNFRNAYITFTLAGDLSAREMLVNDYGNQVEGTSAKSTVLWATGLNALERNQLELADSKWTSAIQHLPHGSDDRLESELRCLQVLWPLLEADQKETEARMKSLKKFLNHPRLLVNDKGQFDRFYDFSLKAMVILTNAVVNRETAFEELWHQVQENTQTIFAKRWLLQAMTNLRKKKR